MLSYPLINILCASNIQGNHTLMVPATNHIHAWAVLPCLDPVHRVPKVGWVPTAERQGRIPGNINVHWASSPRAWPMLPHVSSKHHHHIPTAICVKAAWRSSPYRHGHALA